MEQVLALVVVGLSAAWLLRRAWRALRGGPGGCGCAACPTREALPPSLRQAARRLRDARTGTGERPSRTGVRR
jgi:hypothetical protein